LKSGSAARRSRTMSKFIWVKETNSKFKSLIGVNAIVRVAAVNQVNEERGAK
jgi:hypothetical protein